MTLMHEPLRKLVSQTLFKIIQNQLVAAGVASDAISANDVYKALVDPPNIDLGHLAFGCFITAKNLKKGPPVVAQL